MISNGFDIERINTAFSGRVGWQQPTQSGYPTLATANKQADSGRYYDDFHPQSRIARIYDTQDDDNISDSDFNSLLQRMDKAALLRCLNAVFNRPQLIEHKLNYERQSNLRNVLVPNQGNFCGYRIKVAEGDYAVMLNSISLFFTQASTFNLYLFNDLVKAPLLTKEVTTVANSQTTVTLNWQLIYNEVRKGGLFYIGYFQDDLGTNQAVDEQLNTWADTKIFGAWPFQSSKKAGELDFNRINPSVVFKSYGMNIEVSSYKDYTQKIIQNANMFDEARGLTMAISVLEQIKHTTRSNATERQSNEKMQGIDFDLNLANPTESMPFVAGLKAQLNRELRRLSDQFFPKATATTLSLDGGRQTMYDTFDINKLPPRERNY
jgi:hypothetical protein